MNRITIIDIIHKKDKQHDTVLLCHFKQTLQAMKIEVVMFSVFADT